MRLEILRIKFAGPSDADQQKTLAVPPEADKQRAFSNCPARI